MLISNKLHSFRNFVIQKYKKLLNNLSFAKNNRSFQFFSVILHS